ncbi:MAG TPA: hypothetical protein VEH50_09980 [Methylomirabilota bacterium]|nr:hypothetical protein [Methylomirabilota bacterium]
MLLTEQTKSGCSITQTPVPIDLWWSPQLQAPEPAEPKYLLDCVYGFVPFQVELFSPEEILIDQAAAFASLVSEWHRERGATSSITDMVLCPAYQKIVGMGPKVIELILAQLESEGDNPDHWFWALQVLSGTNPVSEEEEGNLRKMAKTWLRWAAANGYIW